ncbi:MAG: GAF domain-containing protein, partial [Chloroflexia bacterium]
MLVPIEDYRLRQREYLLRIARALTSRLELPKVLRLVIEESVELLQAEAGLIALRDEEHPDLEVYASYGLDEQVLRLFAPLLQGEVLDRLVEEGGWVVPDLALRLRAASSALGVRLRQVVALPLIVGREPMGV